MKYPHEDNLEGKITSAAPGSTKHIDLTNLKTAYVAYRTFMRTLNFQAMNIVDFNSAANAMDTYLAQVTTVCNTYGYTGQDKLRPTVLEELSVLLFERHPAITTGRLEVYNNGIYAGVVVDNHLNYIIPKKNVDFCIGKEAPISINGVTKTAKFPFVCVECKTYVDSTMMHEILFSGTQIKTASPQAKTYLLMEYEDEVGAQHPIPASYAYAIDTMFKLRNCKRSTNNRPVVQTPIVGQYMLDYYIEVDKNL